METINIIRIVYLESIFQLKKYQHYNILFITFYIFNIPVDYEKDLAPKHTRNGERTNDPLPVYLSCEIITFDKISTLDMMFG